MNFRDCIETARKTGRIRDDQAARAKAAFDKHVESALAEGLTEGEAMARAADAATEELTTLNKTKRWSRINEMQRAYEIHQRLSKSNKPWRDLEDIAARLQDTEETVMGMAWANLDKFLYDYRPRVAGLREPTAGLDDIVYASYGDVRSKEAEEVYNAIYDSQEMLREWANSLGVAIPNNPNRRLPQTPEPVRVSAVTEDVFVEDMMNNLDWDLMRYEGRPIPENIRDTVIRETYRGIVTDGFDDPRTAQGNRAGLATRLNRDRFLYYKDADAYMAMMEKYGAGNLHEQVIGMTSAMAKDIALLRTFGPNADAIKEYTKREAMKRAADLDLAEPANQRKNVDRTKRELAVFDNMYELHSRYVPTTDGNFAVNTLATIRTTAVSALLGGVFIPSHFGDIANAKGARKMLNIPTAGVIRGYWQNFVPTEKSTRAAIRDGIIFENGISLAHSRVRYFGMMDGPHWARKFGEFVYRAGLTSHHTQVIRNAEAKAQMGLWADDAAKAFDDLPYAAALAERGIGPEEWDLFRALPQSNNMLRPIDLYRAGYRDEATKFGEFLQMTARLRVPDTSLRSRRAMGEMIDPNSAMGQMVRTTTTLLSFPVSIWFNQLRRIAETPGAVNKIRLGMYYAAWMTAGGAAITQAKALLSGDNPHNMDPVENPEFWLRAFINGGTLGILGDLIVNNLGLVNSGYNKSSPTYEYLAKWGRLGRDVIIDRDKVPKDLLDAVNATIPDLWYMKLILEREWDDTLLELADPTAYARKKRYEREHTEGQWWGQGEDPTAPDLTTAVGG